MNAEQFTMWLHGFFELSGAEELSKTQVSIIKDHLDLLFCKETPDRSERLIEAIKKMRRSPITNNNEFPATTSSPWWGDNSVLNPRQVLC